MEELSQVEYIIDTLNSNGYEGYIVGGCVRDILMHRPFHDIDITTNAIPEQVKGMFDNVIPLGEKFGIVTVVLDSSLYEVATYRYDSNYSDGRRPDSVIFSNSLNDDLARRDFTMNAIACYKNSGYIDPFGGIEDIENGIIRCVGNPEDRFTEDYLRILRALRFSVTLDFNIDPTTSAAIIQLSNRRRICDVISGERIKWELEKMLSSQNVNRLESVLLYYKDVIFSCIPQLKPCDGFDQNNSAHIYDVYTHIVKTVVGVKSGKFEVRMAALLHDIAKPDVYFYNEEKKRGSFIGHPEIGATITENVLRSLKCSSFEIRYITFLVLQHDRTIAPTKKSVKKVMAECGTRECLDDLFELMEADMLAHAGFIIEYKMPMIQKAKEIREIVTIDNEMFLKKDLAINGGDLINVGFEQGIELGRRLEEIYVMVRDGELLNDRNVILKYIKEGLSHA